MEENHNEPIIIQESGMNFGPFDSDQLFHIEACDLYQKTMRPNGVAVTEFAVLTKGKLLFIEAKTSTPNYKECNKSQEKREKYDEYVTSIATKFRDSIDIYASILLKRNTCEQMPDHLAKKEFSDLPIVFVLVIKNAYPDSLRHFTEKFQQVLRPMMRIWNVQNIAVIGEEQARRKGLITADT